MSTGPEEDAYGLISGDGPAWRGRYEGLRFGSLANQAPDGLGPRPPRGSDEPGLFLEVREDSAGNLRVIGVEASGPYDVWASRAEALWGPPDDVDGNTRVWINEVAGVKAHLFEVGGEGRLAQTDWVPFSTTFGRHESGSFGFEAGAPVMGSTVEALAARLLVQGSSDGPPSCFLLPPWLPRHSFARGCFSLDDSGVIVRWGTSVSEPTRAEFDESAQIALEAAWGPPEGGRVTRAPADGRVLEGGLRWSSFSLRFGQFGWELSVPSGR